MASSVDGMIGATNHESDDERILLGLSGSADRSYLIQQIVDADAVIVGASSIRANQECLEIGEGCKNPSWFILAENEIPEDYNFWRQSSIDRFLVSKNQLSVQGDAHFLQCPENESIAKYTYKMCQEMKFNRVLLFGGGLINRMFYNLGLVDELKLTISPLILAQKTGSRLVAEGLQSPCKLTLKASQCRDNFVFLEYTVV